MPQTRLVRPTYSERFRCIGSACEDTCCQGWSVPIDRAAYEKYRELGAGPLRTLIDANILVMPERAVEAKGAMPASFAKIRMNGANQCPLLTEDRLCRIQAELGEGFLSHACATYPRIANSIEGIEEKALTLSCPEAARLVLLNTDLLTPDLLTGMEQPGMGDTAEAAADGVPFASLLVLAHPGGSGDSDSESRLPAMAAAVPAGRFLPAPGRDCQG